MTTRGFEWAYDLNRGSTPLIKDFTLGEGTAYKVGDLCLMQSDGYIDKVAGSIDEVTAICQEAVSSADASAGVTAAKFAVITPSQVWKCSMDASSATGVVAYTKTNDTVDANTIDASDITNGSMILFDTASLDNDGNVLAYVTFADVSFGVQDTDTT